MSDKNMYSRISAYKAAFASGEIQQTYQGLVGIVQRLRTEFAKACAGEFAVANVQHGYIDFTYFYLQNSYLKKNKLKFAMVFNHRHARFELWLLGQTKDVQVHFWKKLKGLKWGNADAMPAYSIFEITLLANPDFDDDKALCEAIRTAFQSLSQEIISTLKACE